jgi:hypothetical protein
MEERNSESMQWEEKVMNSNYFFRSLTHLHPRIQTIEEV